MTDNDAEGREVASSTLQTILLAAGGLLIAGAVIVFTAVSWKDWGDGGRLVFLAGATAVFLTIPLGLKRFGLSATAETFAALAPVALWCSGLAGYYLLLAPGAEFEPSTVAVGTVGVILATLAYRALAGLSAPGWGIVLQAGAGAYYALHEGLWTSLGLLAALAAASAVTALVVKRTPADRSGSDEWAWRVNALAAVLLATLGLARIAFELDPDYFATLAAGLFTLASLGLVVTVRLYALGRPSLHVVLVAVATGVAGLAAAIVSVNTGTPLLMVAGAALTIGVVISAAAAGEERGPRRGAYAAALIPAPIAVGTLWMTIVDSPALVTYAVATVLLAGFGQTVRGELRKGFRQAGLLIGAALAGAAFAWGAFALVVYAGGDAEFVSWQPPAVLAASIFLVPFVQRVWRLELAVLTTVGLAVSLAPRLDMNAGPWATVALSAGVSVLLAAVPFATRWIAVRVVGWVAALTAFAVTAATLSFRLEVDTEWCLLAFSAASQALSLTYHLLDDRREDHEYVLILLHSASIAPLAGILFFDATTAAVGLIAYGTLCLVLAATRAWPAGLTGAAGASYLLSLWVMMADNDVEVIEAYFLPPAVIALGVGILAARRLPEASSWMTIAPGALLLVLPTLVQSFGSQDDLVRRGAAVFLTVAVLLLGTWQKMQAPIVIGAAATIAVCVNEIVMVWTLLPTWAPLAVGGALLVGVGATLEKWRRDVVRLGKAVKSMK
ncbi:SCO7613 C-terminal domain-containing membrane protein [Salininema proteolyticum]|uniref:SCO7613 C-terminal domain-containing membrane protein n=1 Tax=Salininema proteolyticum TaxID=1607685 RepID=A0ABV8TZZ7_9ACTN